MQWLIILNVADKSKRVNGNQRLSSYLEHFECLHHRQQGCFCGVATLETRLVQVKKEVPRQELSDTFQNHSHDGLGQEQEKADQVIDERGFFQQWCYLSCFRCGWKAVGGEGRVGHVIGLWSGGGIYCM